MQPYTGPFERVDPQRVRIPRSYKPEMNVDGMIYANEALAAAIQRDRSPEQVANVACLPGIVGHSLAMPDIHWGYGFCIGGVAATDPTQGGVISPGGVGYDINCGVRLIRTNIPAKRAASRMERLVNELFKVVPCGVGRGGRVKFNRKQLAQLMTEGSSYVVDQGLGWDSDVSATEARGRLQGAEPGFVSDRAYERERRSAARWAVVTTSSRCRSSTTSTTARQPEPWASVQAA